MGAAFTFLVLDYSLENFMRLFFFSLAHMIELQEDIFRNCYTGTYF